MATGSGRLWPAKRGRSFAGLAPGDKVRLELSPYDLSTGRIIVETKTIEI